MVQSTEMIDNVVFSGVQNLNLRPRLGIIEPDYEIPDSLSPEPKQHTQANQQRSSTQSTSTKTRDAFGSCEVIRLTRGASGSSTLLCVLFGCDITICGLIISSFCEISGGCCTGQRHSTLGRIPRETLRLPSRETKASRTLLHQRSLLERISWTTPILNLFPSRMRKMSLSKRFVAD
jgi:hypothetical protein